MNSRLVNFVYVSTENGDDDGKMHERTNFQDYAQTGKTFCLVSLEGIDLIRQDPKRLQA